MNPHSNRNKSKTANSSRNAALVSSLARRSRRGPHSRSHQSSQLKWTLLAPLASVTHRIRTVARKVRRRKRSERQSLWANQLQTSQILMQSKRKRTRLHHSDEARKAVVVITSLALIRMKTLKMILQGRNRSLLSATFQLLFKLKKSCQRQCRASRTSMIGTLTRWFRTRKKRNL